MVIEAVIEDIPLKQRIFADLEQACRPDCILSTNTSTIDINLVGGKVAKATRERILGAHFFSPAHIMPLLEIVKTEHTSKQVRGRGRGGGGMGGLGASRCGGGLGGGGPRQAGATGTGQVRAPVARLKGLGRETDGTHGSSVHTVHPNLVSQNPTQTAHTSRSSWTRWSCPRASRRRPSSSATAPALP